MDQPPSSPTTETPKIYPTAQQSRLLWLSITALSVLSLLGIAALVFYGFITFLSWSYPILLPIGLAVIIAMVLEPVVDFFQHRGVLREMGALYACLLAVVGFILFWTFVLPPVVSEAGGFFKSIPGMVNKGVAKLDASLAGAPETNASIPITSISSVVPPEATNQLTQPAPATNQAPELAASEESSVKKGRSEIQAWLKTNLPAIEQTIQKSIANVIYSALGPVGQAFGFLLGFGFVPIYVYYFLADQERLAKHWQEFVPLRRSELRDEVVSLLAEIGNSLVGYFRGQIVVAACNGALTFIGLWAIGIPYSLVLGIITGALSIVPFLGIIASITPALLLGFLSAQTDSTLQWLRPLLVVVVFAVVQMVESMFITPRVQSHSTGLHPLAIILGILFWSMLLPGLLGPIVAVPLTCAGVVLLRRYVWIDKKVI